MNFSDLGVQSSGQTTRSFRRPVPDASDIRVFSLSGSASGLKHDSEIWCAS